MESSLGISLIFSIILSFSKQSTNIWNISVISLLVNDFQNPVGTSLILLVNKSLYISTLFLNLILLDIFKLYLKDSQSGQ